MKSRKASTCTRLKSISLVLYFLASSRCTAIPTRTSDEFDTPTHEDSMVDEVSSSRVTRDTHVDGNDLEGSGVINSNKKEQPGLGTSANCDFGVGSDISMCKWSNLNMSAFHWVSSSGVDSYWIGGPRIDDNEKNKQGGYVFFETSQLPNEPKAANTVSAMMSSPLLASTGSKGHCVSFSYAMDGLSADKMKVLLHPHDDNSLMKEEEAHHSDDKLMINDNTRVESNHPSTDFLSFKDSIVLSTMQDSTRGKWKRAQVMYSYPAAHKIVLEALPKDETNQGRRYRGYLAIDNLVFEHGDACKGHCTFDSGLCSFENTGDENEDDFDWKVGRGHDNPNTGPIRDHSSFVSNRVTGSFAYIDASPPRRPLDRAQLISSEFPATKSNNPLCLRFWTHMFGSGIGELNVYIKSGSSGMKKIWSLSGDAGNNWYMGQAPISSVETYKIVFEGTVGRNSLGNIAIDDIAIAPGVCPTSPQVASPYGGDCAFEDDFCGWKNSKRSDNIDEINWDRIEARTLAGGGGSGGSGLNLLKASSSGSKTGPSYPFPQTDHTTGTRNGYYMDCLETQYKRQVIERS